MSQLITTWLHWLLRIGVRRRVALRRGTLTLSLSFRDDAIVLTTILLFAVFLAWRSYNAAQDFNRVGDAMMSALLGMFLGLIASTLPLFIWRDPLLRVLVPFLIANAILLGFAGYLCAQLLAPAFRNADLHGQLVFLGILDALTASVLIFHWASGRTARHKWLYTGRGFGLFFLFGLQCSHGHGLVWMFAGAGVNGMLGLIVMRPFLVPGRLSRK